MKNTINLFLITFLIGCLSDKDHSNAEEQLQLSDSAMTKIDSLILTDVELPKVLNYLYFDTATIAVFQNLATETSGELYLAANANLVVETIIEVLEKQGEDNIDLCFLIDKTGSMMDDISLMQSSMERIFTAIKAYQNVNVALAYYGDKNIDGRQWIEINGFSQDFKKLEADFKNVRYSGGGDAPESVTDGAYEVINKLKWTSNNKRMILLLGDAPSLVPPLATHTVDDVIKEAKSKDILMNYYPIVVGFAGTKTGPIEQKLLASVYPNPSKGIFNLLFENEQEYNVEVFNSAGTSVYIKTVNTKKHQIDLSDQPNDLYVIRILTKNNSNVDSRKVLITK